MLCGGMCTSMGEFIPRQVWIKSVSRNRKNMAQTCENERWLWPQLKYWQTIYGRFRSFHYSEEPDWKIIIWKISEHGSFLWTTPDLDVWIGAIFKKNIIMVIWGDFILHCSVKTIISFHVSSYCYYKKQLDPF